MIKFLRRAFCTVSRHRNTGGVPLGTLLLRSFFVVVYVIVTRVFTRTVQGHCSSGPQTSTLPLPARHPPFPLLKPPPG